jgi:hypothetical protein
MRNIFWLYSLSVGCGYNALNSTFTGQVKYVEKVNPIVCDEFTGAGISLGVMRNGTGSVSTHDVEVYVPDQINIDLLSAASKSGSLVTVTYDARRVSFCKPPIVVRSVELVK